MSKKCQTFPQTFTSIHRFCLPSSTISPYFNSSYYSFLTFLTLYPIFSIYLKNNFLLRANGGFNPQPPLAYASVHQSTQCPLHTSLYCTLHTIGEILGWESWVSWGLHEILYPIMYIGT